MAYVGGFPPGRGKRSAGVSSVSVRHRTDERRLDQRSDKPG